MQHGHTRIRDYNNRVVDANKHPAQEEINKYGSLVRYHNPATYRQMAVSYRIHNPRNLSR